MTPVKQYPITELGVVSQPSSKNLSLTFSTLAEPLLFHCGDSSTASAIIAKLESSKAAAGEALEMAAAESRGAADSGEEHDEYEAPIATGAGKAVRWAPAPTTPTENAETATVMYDFVAQGEDELSVTEHELVTIIDKENDEWWSVKNATGREGVVPAQYVQLNDGSASAQAAAADDGYDSEDVTRRAEDEAAAAAAVQIERTRERERKAEQRRAIEKAARDKQRQEEEDRQYALEVEEKEKAKAERREKRRQEETRAQREAEAEKR